MKICRFNHDRLGVVDGEVVRDVSAALDALPQFTWPFPLGDPVVANLSSVRRRVHELLPDAPSIALADVRLESPVANPGKIIGAPVNYRSHEDEIDDDLRHGHVIKPISEWGLFLKANSALCGPAAGVRRRFPDARTDHEVELAVVIGREGSDIPAHTAMSYVAGYCIGLDVTLRGPQFQCFRKSIDSYAVVGPWLVTADEIADPGHLAMSLSVNGEIRQSASTDRLILDIPRLIALASSFYTLHPGDIIMTGTPAGVGPLLDGDIMHAKIEDIGEMTVVVSDHSALSQ